MICGPESASKQRFLLQEIVAQLFPVNKLSGSPVLELACIPSQGVVKDMKSVLRKQMKGKIKILG